MYLKMNKQWYSNKEIFEMVQGLKEDEEPEYLFKHEVTGLPEEE